MLCIDMDLMTVGSEDRWDEWDHLISAKWSGLSDKPKLSRNAMDIGKWPSYRVMRSNRVRYGETVESVESDEDAWPSSESDEE